VGYWRFDGTTYRDTKVITPISDDWKVEAIGDFDGDKSEDILWRNKLNGELVAYLMDGSTGTIRSQATLKNPTTGATWPVDQSWQAIGIGDVNGDGKGDIIWRNAAAEAVSIWVMNGTQVVGATPPVANGVGLTVGAGFNLVSVSDLTGDGKADLLWQHSSGVVISWVMDGANRVGAVTMSNQPTAGYKIEAVNDFNGDGKADLFWRNSVGNVQMWLGTGQVDAYQVSALSSTSNLPVSNVSLAFQIAGTDDFNGDGKADIVWRHDTGVLSLWSMNGSQVNYMENVAIPVLSQKPVGASTRLETANIIQLAGISDSGESNSDWITNVRAPSFAGVTSAGSTVSLFGNNQLIGETKVAANGTWSIVTTTLDDGIYDISQKVTNTAGAFTQQILPKKLMIDGTAADLKITGPIDGVAWDSQVELAGFSWDLDPQAKVEYSVKADGTLAFSAVLSAAIEAPPTPTFLTKKTIGTTAIALGQATGAQIFKPYEIGLKVTDRAGNISTQTYKGMRLNLPELTEESILLSNSLMPNIPDDRLVTNGNNNPIDSSGGALYIGVGGGWGYGSTGGGAGSGGSNWNTSANTFPTIPTSVLNPNEVIGYLPTLRLMLATAIGVLSNHPATASKKESLKQQLEMLMAVGEVVETNSFYQSMQPMLQGLFAKAYTLGGMTKRQAILNGWQFAKDLAISPALTGLQVFQANLYAVGLAALKQNGVSNVTGLKGAIEGLSVTYAKLNPIAETYPDYGNAGFSFENFLDNLWNNGRSADYERRMGYRTVYRSEQDSISQAITNLGQHFKGQIDPARALQLLNQTLQAATQVRQLHEDRFVVINGAANGVNRIYSSSIKDAEFLKHVAHLSFEIARSNPTVTVGPNPTSEWIETLWEGGNLQSAAGGLSDWFSGFQVEKPVNPDLQANTIYGNQMRSARSLKLRALDYADRFVRANQSVGNLAIAEVKQADFLSHLVNLGGVYAALNPNYETSIKSFLNTLQLSGEGSVAAASNELAAFYLSNEFPLQTIKLIKNTLVRLLPSDSEMDFELSRDARVINRMIEAVQIYSSFHNDVNSVYPESVVQALEFVGREQEIEEFEISPSVVIVASLPGQGSNLIAYTSPLDLLDYLGLGITVLERLYIEIGMKPGKEKEFAKFVNTLYLAIDVAMASLPGAGGAGLAARASHEFAVTGWGTLPTSVKQKIIEKVAKDLGWTLVNTSKAVNAFFSSKRDPNSQINSGSQIPKRQTPRMEDGNLKEGWIHIDARHVSGNHPTKGAGDLFPSGTTRGMLEDVAKKIVLKGTRLTKAGRQIVTYEGKVKILKKNLLVRVTVDSNDANRIITVFPVGP
jgi:Bacterial Ig-like domain/FG-GAP-like repeat